MGCIFMIEPNSLNLSRIYVVPYRAAIMARKTLVTDANGQYRRSERLGRIIVEEKINRRRRKERHSRQQREGNIHDAFNNNS